MIQSTKQRIMKLFVLPDCQQQGRGIKMDQKHYLFYQKQSIGTFWKNSFHLEKFFLICFLLFSLFMAGGFIYITFCSTDPAVAAPLLASVWLFLFPGMTFFCHRTVKSYWVFFQEHTVLRHGSYGYFTQKKIIPYEKATYILIGNLQIGRAHV